LRRIDAIPSKYPGGVLLGLLSHGLMIVLAQMMRVQWRFL